METFLFQDGIFHYKVDGRFQGIVVDLLDELSRMLNFRYVRFYVSDSN